MAVDNTIGSGDNFSNGSGSGGSGGSVTPPTDYVTVPSLCSIGINYLPDLNYNKKKSETEYEYHVFIFGNFILNSDYSMQYKDVEFNVNGAGWKNNGTGTEFVFTSGPGVQNIRARIVGCTDTNKEISGVVVGGQSIGGGGNKCDNILSWKNGGNDNYNTPADGSKRQYHIFINGNAGNDVEYSINGGSWVNGGSGGEFVFTSNNGKQDVSARIAGCSAILTGQVYGSGPRAKITLTSPQDVSYNNQVAGGISYTFNLSNETNQIRVSNDYTATINVTGATATITIPQSSLSTRGAKTFKFTPINQYGEGDSIDTHATIYSEITTIEPDVIDIKYPATIYGQDYKGADADFEVEWNTKNDATYVNIKIKGTDSIIKVPNKGKQKFNVSNILKLTKQQYDEYSASNITFSLELTPYKETALGEVKGKTETIVITFDSGERVIPRATAIERIAKGFIEKFDTSVFSDETSKYLTHIAQFGNGDNKPITTWVGDRGTLILKLYEPLSRDYQVSSELWISKIQSQTMIETISISGEDSPYCNALRGPNFNIESNDGFGFKIFNDLINSGSVSSNNLISNYLQKRGINTSELGIEYSIDDTIAYQNFVHFGSAEERLNNFMYKLELIEKYRYNYALLSNSSYSPDNGVIITESSDAAWADIWSYIGILQTEPTSTLPSYNIAYEISTYNTLSDNEQAKNILKSIHELINGFDGFEKYLFFGSGSASYPKVPYQYPNGVEVQLPDDINSSSVINWYESSRQIASAYDYNNINYLVKHIPDFLRKDSENQDFMVFLDMIGQHFDNIWVYINKLSQLKNIKEQMIPGVNDDMVYHLLKSFGWDGRRAYNSNYLWEYLYGTDKDGNIKYSMPLQEANNQIWNRILNNLPYLLKHKGTNRSLRAIMSCYGIPPSLLTIMEFSGITDGETSREYTYDDYTAALLLKSGSFVNVQWKQIPTKTSHPNSIELRFLPTTNHNFRLISGSGFYLDFSASNADYSKMYFYLSGSGTYTSSLFPISTENYSNLLIRRDVLNTNTSSYDITIQTTNGITIQNEFSMSFNGNTTPWTIGSFLTIGGNFNGTIDEFRLWNGKLDLEKYEIHTLQPDSIVGNSYTASTEDLMFRLDFEYPKNLNTSNTIKNVSISTLYDSQYATASNMYSATTYPYQYVSYERNSTAIVPSLGNTVSNKIRFEDITLVSDLSPDTRSTIKSFDRSGVDTNRLGIFLSPIKELNMDIIKTFGKFNIDNYIGDPSDEWNDSYSELNTIRNYYFQRLDRNIYEYIQLVKYIDKSLFNVLSDLTPARAAVSKGLLIEPHYLERSKHRLFKPTGDYKNYDGSIDTHIDRRIESNTGDIDMPIEMNTQYVLTSEHSNIETDISTDDTYVFNTEYLMHDAVITHDDVYTLDTEYPTYPSTGSYGISCDVGATVSGQLDTIKSTFVGMDPYSISNLGFGLWSEPNTTGSILYREYNEFTGFPTTASWKRAFVVKEQYFLNQLETTKTSEGLYIQTQSVQYKYSVTLVPSGSLIQTGSNIIEVTPINGYLQSHYKFRNTLSEGNIRSFFKGSVQTINTTPDGKSPVEIVYTNPNRIKVTPTGRGSGEPILIVE